MLEHFSLSNPETWVAIAFIIFVVLAGKPIVRGLGKTLDARAARIKAELDEARALRDEAQKLLADYQKKQQEAMRDAEAIVRGWQHSSNSRQSHGRQQPIRGRSLSAGD